MQSVLRVHPAGCISLMAAVHHHYFVARTYNGDAYKYKNPNASKDIIFNELFIDWNTDLVLVEGNIIILAKSLHEFR
mgnify:CR=1 FL=1